MASRGGRLAVAALWLLGLAAISAEPAAAEPGATPTTIRGAAATTAGSEGAGGSSIILRGSPPPVPPAPATYICPPGYTNEAGIGCVAPGYAYEPDYEWYAPPVDFGRRGRGPRPHRHTLARFRRGFGHPVGPHRR